MVAEIVVFCAWQPNQFAPAAVGCPRVFHIPAANPQPGVISGAAEKCITKLHFEGVRRGIPGTTPSTGTNPTTWKSACLRDIHGRCG